MTQRVAITGASGLVGGALSSSLRARGDEVIHLVRRTPRAPHEVQWDPAAGTVPSAALAGVTAVVNLAGAPINEGRWTPARKHELLHSRTDGTSALASAIAAGRTDIRLVNGSAVGIYGDRGDEILTEESAPGTGFLRELVQAWEGATAPAAGAGASVALARTGIVFSREGGAMGRVLPLARLGLGGPLGSGRQWWPWISLVDEVAALTHLIDRPDIVGPVILSAPAPARQRAVAKALGARLHRPAILPVPSPALKLVLGGMATEVLGSKRVSPGRLVDSGFTFAHPDLGSCLEWLVPR
ncbi:TIGR01777 family oxidoreductase [Janibacter sp. G56]|uniref:TIGR01777 family oxidoreductase n=1 Tax=Janibacter sp. G56 TaxID=3418717 RepID=UPI003D02D125